MLLRNAIRPVSFNTYAEPRATLTEIDTPYGRGHEYVSAGSNWQWINIKLEAYADSGIIRVPVRKDEGFAVGVFSENFGSDGSPDIGVIDSGGDWSVIDIPADKTPGWIKSWYGAAEGTVFDICDMVTFVGAGERDMLDAIGVPVFDGDLMPLGGYSS